MNTTQISKSIARQISEFFCAQPYSIGDLEGGYIYILTQLHQRTAIPIEVLDSDDDPSEIEYQAFYLLTESVEIAAKNAISVMMGCELRMVRPL